MTFILLLCLFINLIQAYHMNIGGTGILFSYTLGALAYIKTCIRPANHTLTGVSGGAWCAVLYHLEPDISDHDLLWSIMVGDKKKTVSLLHRNSMYPFQQTVAHNLRVRYRFADMENLPISIIATKYNRGVKNTKINKFDDINDLISYCLCSSYIPYISGKTMFKTYKDTRYIDGELFRDHRLFDQNALTIHKNTWNRKYDMYSHLFLDFDKSHKLFQDGWNDAKVNLKCVQ